MQASLSWKLKIKNGELHVIGCKLCFDPETNAQLGEKSSKVDLIDFTSPDKERSPLLLPLILTSKQG